MSDKPRPYPTPTRLRLLEDIAADRVRCWHFIAGYEVRRTYDDHLVTARVDELEQAGLIERGAKPEHTSEPTRVQLTDAGRTYLDTYGKNGADT